jgi:hypothetical protein
MIKRIVLVLLTLVALARPAAATQIVVTFEDQDDIIGFQTPFPTTYAGITWTDWRHYAPYAGPYDADGVNAIYAGDDGAKFEFSDQVFAGASFSAPYLFAPGYVGSTLYFELYLDGALVHTSGNLSSDQLSFLSSGYSGLVDEVVVRSDAPMMTSIGAAWIMDNVTFGVPDTGSTFALLGGSLAALALLRRRFV